MYIIVYMNDPIKILYKFKNNNRRVQYHVYIFVGDVNSEVKKILTKIKELNLYDTLVSLSDKEHSIMKKIYGEKWYAYFFNTYHIMLTLKNIRNIDSNKKEIQKKLGKKWFEEHVNQPEIIKKDIFYSYDSVIKQEKERKMNKRDKLEKENEDDIVNEEIDYETSKNKDKAFDVNLSRFNLDDEEDEDENEEMMYENVQKQELQNDIIDEEMDEIEDIYKDTDVELDKDIIKTTEMIQSAFNNKNVIKKTIKMVEKFGQHKDNNIHEEQLKNVYEKNYVMGQYIFKDDTIRMIKNKIMCSIKNNEKFSENSYLLPSRTYLWSEYYFENKLQKVMIGQKFLRKNELLKVDIEPNNNLRVYEELRKNLRLLRDNLKRYGSKIKREDDEYNILYDYQDYYTNNEIFMIDIYNELGQNYEIEKDFIKNLQDVYLKLYFPKISTEDFKYILEYLNGKTKVEDNKLHSSFETVNNDLIMQNEIMKVVENIRAGPKNYFELFKENYITQSVIHVNLRKSDENKKIDLFRIFDEFIVNEEYPFIQYQTNDGQIIYKFKEDEIKKYHEKHQNIELLGKWFENEPYGLSFKVRIAGLTDKFLAINLNETGRVEYKTQWKEEDMATIEDIQKTYEYVKDLIRKLNKERNKIEFDLPVEQEFRYAFINTIQKFELPGKHVINHNDLSEFSRFFYPYVALVIEPRKRKSKGHTYDDKGKYGTYLRYKRVSKYENQARIEQRILYFMRNYDHTEQTLAEEISKQFNITEQRAYAEIDKVRTKYTNIKKSRKVLKKLENIPKYKPPGINIDIQGKTRDMYKIRISGARDNEQLNRIISFLAVLLHLYSETYLLKKPERQELREKLNKLTNIAKRTKKVDDFVNYDKQIKSVKAMIKVDKSRIGFKPDKGQNQWTRSCQNSGKDKKRRPQWYTKDNIDELLKKGYKFNKKTDMYERVVEVKQGSTKKKVTIKAVKMKDVENHDNGGVNDIYYACSPDENGEHFYIGFLSRSNHPLGYCTPCCFKKDPSTSRNKEKKNYWLSCVGQIKEKDKDKPKKQKKIQSDKLYILQDTNKIHEGRFSFLPKYLDIFLNISLNKSKTIKQHYLFEAKNGYFFKYGTPQLKNQFLHAISFILSMEPNNLINRLCEILENDKKDKIFCAINNGDIRTQFKTRENFIQFLRAGENISYEILNHFITIPNVISNHGINIIGFEKMSKVIKHAFEKERIKEDFVPICQNFEEKDNIFSLQRENVFIIKENNNFYPILMIKKFKNDEKKMEIIKSFKYERKDDNIINHISDYLTKNCFEGFIEDIGHRHTSVIAKDMYQFLLNTKKKEYEPTKQVIDSRNKCKYIITKDNTIIPVKPSGTVYFIDIIDDVSIYLQSFENMFEKLTKISKLSENINLKPIGVYYESKSGNNFKVVSIMTETYDIVPIIPKNISKKDLDKMNLKYEDKPLYDKIDKQIKNKKKHTDERVVEVNKSNFMDESYQLFRLEFSEYINNKQNQTIRNQIVRIITNKKISLGEKRIEIKRLIFRLIDKELYELFEKTIDRQLKKKQKGGMKGSFVKLVNDIPDISDYQIKNNRDVCEIHETKDLCSKSPHCIQDGSVCKLALTKRMVIKFINMISEELAQYDLLAKEILQQDEYFVSDIADYNKFVERKGQRIIKNTNTKISKILEKVFGKENIPKIGRRKFVDYENIDFDQMNENNPLKDMKEFYIQNIISNNLSCFRGYVNGFYWIKHKYYDPESRNLGYYSDIQMELVNHFRSVIIDWLYDNKNNKQETSQFDRFIETKNKENRIDFIIDKISNNTKMATNCVVELHVLSKLQNKYPIYVYNDESKLQYIFHNGLIFDFQKHNLMDKQYKKYHEIDTKRKSINLRFSYITGRTIPDEVEVIYYK